jgi:hypothetical protein
MDTAMAAYPVNLFMPGLLRGRRRAFGRVLHCRVEMCNQTREADRRWFGLVQFGEIVWA